MDNRKRWLVLLIILVLVLIFFNMKFLGLSIINTTSEVSVLPDNYPPVIWGLDDNLYVCEGESLFHIFYANDTDGGALTGRIVPQDPFYVFFISQTTPNTNDFVIVSGLLSKLNTGGVNSGSRKYVETVYVSDNYNSTCCEDSQEVNITVIEINNIPAVQDIGVQTVWTSGDNTEFYEDWNVIDTEFNYGYGTLTYNISIFNSTGASVDLFNISATGILNFTANNETPLGVYNVTVCVIDTGLVNKHQNITDVCAQTGDAFIVCDNFGLTVTDENRPPEIIDYFPNNLSLIVSGTDNLYFNITKYDPDGTIPDARWYVDGVLKEYDSGSLIDHFNYTFGCDVSGSHDVFVEITDGQFGDSLRWNIAVEDVRCFPEEPDEPSSTSSGGPSPPQVNLDFSVEPLFITTTVLKQQGKSFDIIINNTGDMSLNFELDIVNISDKAILDNESFSLGYGKGKILRLYLYALAGTPQGVYFGKIIVKAGNIQKEIKIVLEVREKEPLFDLRVIVPNEYKRVYPGEEVKALVNMLNVGMYGTAVDVEFYLYITDLDKVLIYELKKETIAVETNLSLERMLYIPPNTVPGTYLVLGEAKYTNITVSTYDTFYVGEKKYVRVSYFIILAVILALIAFILFLVYKRRKKKQYED